MIPEMSDALWMAFSHFLGKKKVLFDTSVALHAFLLQEQNSLSL